MNKTNKIIIIFYIFLTISYGSFIFYMDYEFKDAVFLNASYHESDEEIKLITTVNIDKNDIFDVMTDLEKYKLILPDNVVSIKIINQTDNMIYAEEEFSEKFIKSKFLVKHTIEPYESHLIEILDGDAEGTTFLQTYDIDDKSGQTIITTKVNLDFKGVLTPFLNLPRHLIVDKIVQVNGLFLNYAKGFDDGTKKIVDDMYREILQRPADEEGFQYWGSLLESGKITKDEMRQEFLEHQEEFNKNVKDSD